MGKNRIRVLGFLTLIAVFSLGFLSAETGKSASASAVADLEKLGFTVFPSPQDVPNFTAQALNGLPQRLGDLKGKIVLLNFWATWCPPCRAEMPALDALWQKEKGRAFTIMGISVGEEKKTVADFIQKAGYSYPIFLDTSGELGTTFGARSIPTTYILDKSGKAIAGKIGGADYDSKEAAEIFARLSEQ